MSTSTLLRTRRFLPLFVTQTLGAFNDNLFKNALVVLALYQMGSAGPIWVALSSGIFILPYALFSATAGQLADKMNKDFLIRVTKSFEVLLMGLAAWGFYTGDFYFLMATLFGLGAQATFFSPLKYGILPEHLRESELVAGNGLIEAGTFVGILLGTIAGGALILLPDGGTMVSLAAMAVAVAGLVSAFKVPPAQALAPDLRLRINLLALTAELIADARKIRSVWLSMLGLSWFWAMGATLLAEFPAVAKDTLRADGQVVTALLTVFSVGVGIGSIACAKLLRDEVSARYVPFAALGISIFTWDFARAAEAAGHVADVAALLAAPQGWRMLGDLFGIAFCGGVYSVPLYAIVQEESPPDHRARMIAANNVVNAVAMVLGAGMVAGMAALGVSAPTILLVAAGVNLLAAAWIIRILPHETVRAIFRFYFRVCHGVTITGLEHYPGPAVRAVVAVNHLSYLDGIFVAAFLPGTPMFAVNRHTAARWWARPFVSLVRNFKLDPANPFAAKTMVREVQAGARLVIFPEGRLTMTGALMKLYDGTGMVADKAGAVIVPVRIDGFEVTPFSKLRGILPRRWFPRLSLTILPPVTVAVDPALRGRRRRQALGAQVLGLFQHARFVTQPTDHSLFAELLAAAHRYGPRRAIAEDLALTPITYRRLLLGAAILGRALHRGIPGTAPVGVMLPNANGAVASFFALQAFGRVPAMLNFSAGAEGMLAACRLAGVSVVVSSRAFVERAKLAPIVARMADTVTFIWLEDVRARLGLLAKLRGLLALRRPGTLPGLGASADAAAVILFTSGSEGQPKGVVLSHRNILANCAQARAVVDFNPTDRVFNALPMFHGFGLTGGTLLPLFSGVRVFFYPSPLHYRIVPELIYDTDATICFGTDTFLTGWARYAHPYDFRSMRYVFAGAERVRPETRQLYAERFGVRVLEGYGATETSPVLALNVPMAARVGSVGKLLPGIDARLEPISGITEGGRLLVRGPTIMLGYYRASAPGVLEAPPDGWYDTGDIAVIDADGFVTLRGRIKRFAKIAGEMVSLAAAEDLAQRLWPDAQHAVIAQPDPRKGEQLLLVTTQPAADPAALLAAARAAGLPELAVPRRVRIVDKLPLLGTGKIDYPTVAARVAGD